MQEHEFTTRLMGSDTTISIVGVDSDRAQQEYERALALGCSYEERFTRFMPTSELSQVNTAKHARVSAEFLEALMLACELYTETRGVFNVLARVEALGYTEDFQSLHTHQAPCTVSPYDLDPNRVHIDVTQQTVTLGPTQQVDFGGFLKGHVAQRMAELIDGVPGVIVNIGGDSYTRGNDQAGSAFCFSVYNPVTQCYPYAIPVTNAAIATSGTYRRRWYVGTKEVHHILGASGVDSASSDIVSATVVHPEGARADAYATAAVVLGSVDAITFLSVHATAFALITTDGTLITHPLP